MGRKLYVGNLPDSATEQDLRYKFAAYGTLKFVKLITDRDIGRNKGFGFIEMMSEAEAYAAIDSLNGTVPIVMGESLRLELPRLRTDSNRRSFKWAEFSHGRVA